jgi:hypothetical protein
MGVQYFSGERTALLVKQILTHSTLLYQSVITNHICWLTVAQVTLGLVLQLQVSLGCLATAADLCRKYMVSFSATLLDLVEHSVSSR